MCVLERWLGGYTLAVAFVDHSVNVSMFKKAGHWQMTGFFFGQMLRVSKLRHSVGPLAETLSNFSNFLRCFFSEALENLALSGSYSRSAFVWGFGPSFA